MKLYLKRHMPLILLGLALLCAWYSYANRYFLRFLPLPISLVDTVNKDGWLIPSFTPSKPLGTFALGGFDMTTEEGLRNTLNRIQNLSPWKRVSGIQSYVYNNFDEWLKEVVAKPIYCTDGSLLIILAAKQQGLLAREWHLLPPDWPPGAGHSVTEIFNPKTQSWQLVDGQHASIIRDKAGKILDMMTVLRLYAKTGREDIRVDYGPYKKQMLAGMRGPSTEYYFFDAKLLDTPVLQLRQPTWYSSVARNFGISGHFVIGYPIMVKGWSHDNRILTSKLTALGLIFFFGLFVIEMIYRRRFRKNV